MIGQIDLNPTSVAGLNLRRVDYFVALPLVVDIAALAAACVVVVLLALAECRAVVEQVEWTFFVSIKKHA